MAVTANDYDPDGEAIAVVDVGAPGHGSVEVGTASTVVYTPEPGYVGLDEFEYTDRRRLMAPRRARTSSWSCSPSTSEPTARRDARFRRHRTPARP